MAHHFFLTEILDEQWFILVYDVLLSALLELLRPLPMQRMVLRMSAMTRKLSESPRLMRMNISLRQRGLDSAGRCLVYTSSPWKDEVEDNIEALRICEMLIFKTKTASLNGCFGKPYF